MKKLFVLAITLILITACTQHVTLEPSPGPVSNDPLYEANAIHYDTYTKWWPVDDIDVATPHKAWDIKGNCKAWTYYMQEKLDLPYTAPVLAKFRGQEHMVLGIWHEHGFYVSDVNRIGIVHANNAELGDYAVLIDGRWVEAEMLVENTWGLRGFLKETFKRQ